ncbi:MAG: YtxH domain-containing protein [Elusimicrobia bacterium]|nr:YtxH domain-containing protein [Elusimicrobiota bacterium]
MIEEKKGVPPWAYFLGGLAAGATLGVLFAPKKGSELRADIKDWTKERAEQGRAFVEKIKKETPAALEHAKEAIAAVKERAHLVKS